MPETLQDIIDKLWTAPKHAEWTPKVDVLALSDIRRWMANQDIGIVGLAYHLLHDGKFRIDPPIQIAEYVDFTKHYFERCFLENPDGDWSDSRYSGGGTLVNIFASLWKDPQVPREFVADLKTWLARLYKHGDAALRTCIVHATLEHLFEQKPIREFFSDWQKDEVLAVAHREASEWYQGGGQSPLGKPPFTPD